MSVTFGEEDVIKGRTKYRRDRYVTTFGLWKESIRCRSAVWTVEVEVLDR